MKLIILPILISAIFLLGCTPVDLDALAQCVSESGAKMYGAYWCGACATQKHTFKESWQYIEYVECSTPNGKGQVEECREAGIQSYPTWVFEDGSKQSGVLTPEKLAEITGC